MSIDLDNIKIKCELLLAYMKSKGGGDMINELTAVLEKAYLQKNSKGLQAIFNDLTEWTLTIQPVHSNKDIDIILNEFSQDRRETAMKIISSGEISNDAEYEVLNYFVDTNYKNNTDNTSILAANDLLSDYLVKKKY